MLAQVYRRFGEVDAAGTVYERVAVALSESAEAMRAIETALPARRRNPTAVLAALHYLALAGQAPALAAAYTAADAAGPSAGSAAAATAGSAAAGSDAALAAGRAGGTAGSGAATEAAGSAAAADADSAADAAGAAAGSGAGGGADADVVAGAAVETLLRMTGSVAEIAVRWRVRADETGRGTVLYPAVAEAAYRVGADAVGLIDVGCGAGLNLTVDRVGISYGAGQRLGDPASPVQLSCSIVNDRPVPARAIPDVVARIGIDPDPVDVTDPDEARWLRACRWPGRPERAARLDAELALAAADPPDLLRGDVVELLPDALARVPAGVLPVVTTTWALSSLSLENRLRFLQRLDAAATHRPVAWVSAEGVGVAPAIPTMGDRPASGHTILGLAVFEHSVLRAEALGRCWSRGRLLAWLAGA
ncbi:MAG TPA: DUF2332 domain-containing protein [Mycobacteriales bacterium]